MHGPETPDERDTGERRAAVAQQPTTVIGSPKKGHLSEVNEIKMGKDRAHGGSYSCFQMKVCGVRQGQALEGNTVVLRFCLNVTSQLPGATSKSRLVFGKRRSSHFVRNEQKRSLNALLEDVEGGDSAGVDL